MVLTDVSVWTETWVSVVVEPTVPIDVETDVESLVVVTVVGTRENDVTVPPSGCAFRTTVA